MRLLLSPADIDEGLDALVAADPRLALIRQTCGGTVEIRYRAPGFEGVARIVVAQMLSVASANAIWTKLERELGTVTPQTFLAADEPTLRRAGLSGGKIRTLTAVAEASIDGLDLAGLATAPADEAVAALTALPGIGRWTAEIFLLFCARHADVFPAGDLALQVAAAEGLGLPERPSEKALRAMAEDWAPWRGVAAKLFWAYHKACREGRNAVPV
ncbi:DNA-3-methyladenine glycosylase family protein [Chthonobacter albigriseus]|uniref:DNA-3-methyladenine glycosylase family protein n=1 Tax=Chthonobacter albigriseus TaxID=1683161 RepID=UPI0015EE71B3|nr:DNA-3-methyladenine glycosylase 2 family protein [Chthonobacter albigriseus]